MLTISASINAGSAIYNPGPGPEFDVNGFQLIPLSSIASMATPFAAAATYRR